MGPVARYVTQIRIGTATVSIGKGILVLLVAQNVANG
jgi:hypothetical protein